ncbi:uncharacterized protein LACBIDRAFT_323386 [Laccaria bicolor S238N-H82]|uniref:Predicted protein n=1 Tax=Laccaria bicolor (strain S238N-H82 / ATCC MYA-4686) TaxID=486041 RepID=B0CXF9_LACBS|nr:uncharacterized protein LACBIDRAFT_323386 [Laccaria bicolor S238N-H82]EDR12715.1 predicted protein [Laccaria bicolor S238N-H82]|eukprot:XP_001876979.1 predicted protein [Laccaria bicolor S238N-H82]
MFMAHSSSLAKLLTKIFSLLCHIKCFRMAETIFFSFSFLFPSRRGEDPGVKVHFKLLACGGVIWSGIVGRGVGVTTGVELEGPEDSISSSDSSDVVVWKNASVIHAKILHEWVSHWHVIGKSFFNAFIDGAPH